MGQSLSGLSEVMIQEFHFPPAGSKIESDRDIYRSHGSSPGARWPTIPIYIPGITMAQIGNFTLHSIETGLFGLDGGAMFGIVPKVLWEKRTTADNHNRVPLRMRCLLLEAENRLILIDNGLGTKYNEKFAFLYGIDDSEINLTSSLASAGFSFDDITDVILTHLHFDHCGGSTVRRKGRIEVAFPNARFHVQRAHWNWANQANPREKASFLAENLDPLRDSGQLALLDGVTDLFPGVTVFPVDGHTKEMQLVKIHDDKNTLVFVADLLPTHAHLAPAWNMAYDLWPLTTIAEKGAFLSEAIEGGWKLFFEHDASVVLSDVEMTDRGPKIKDSRLLEEL